MRLVFHISRKPTPEKVKKPNNELCLQTRNLAAKHSRQISEAKGLILGDSETHFTANAAMAARRHREEARGEGNRSAAARRFSNCNNGGKTLAHRHRSSSVSHRG